MKSFLMKHDENGKSVFVDKKDKAAFMSLLSIYKERKEFFLMTISQREKKTTESQLRLWNVLMSMIAKESGNDVATIEKTILNDFSKLNEEVQTMSNERFQELLNYATTFAIDFFQLNITIENGSFQIKKL